MLSERQQRELDYHKDYAARTQRPRLVRECIEHPTLRWWNAYWTFIAKVKSADLRGKRVLVPGCGFGLDAVSLAILGAEVYAFDLSPELVESSRALAAEAKVDVDLRVLPAEKTDYPDTFFDAFLVSGILHHCDIPSVLKEIRRVAKPRALVFIDEPYTHSWVQRVRESYLVNRVLYPRLLGFIYDHQDPYITEDERKLNQRDMRMLEGYLEDTDWDYFYCVAERIFPSKFQWIFKLDRMFLRVFRPFGWLLCSRFLLSGRLRPEGTAATR